MTEKKTKSAPEKSKKTEKKAATPKATRQAGAAKQKAVSAEKKTGGIRKAKPYRTPLFSHLNTSRKWYLVDCKDQIVGRTASAISKALRGKNKPTFTSHLDAGDFVVAINADKIRFTGRKWDQKLYHTYSGYIGGLTSITAQKLKDKSPTMILRKAVWGMLPKDSLGRHFLTKLKIYAGAEHPHAAQKPEILSIKR